MQFYTFAGIRHQFTAVHMHNIVSKSWYISHALRFFMKQNLRFGLVLGQLVVFHIQISLHSSVCTKNLINIKLREICFGMNMKLKKQAKNTHSIVGCQPQDSYIITFHSIIVWCDLSKRYISFVSLYCSKQLMVCHTRRSN